MLPKNIAVKTFNSYNPETFENSVNNFLNEYNGSIVDIKFSTTTETFDCMITYIYKEID